MNTQESESPSSEIKKWKVTIPMMCVGHEFIYEVEASSKEEAQKRIENGEGELISDEPDYEGLVWEDAKFKVIK